MFFADRKEKKLVQTTYILDRTKKILNVRFLLTLGALDDVGPSQFV